VDRKSLLLLLAQGLSLAEIGDRFDRDESTVRYWIKRHGLKAVHAEKHAGRGGLAFRDLEQFIDEGLSVKQIALRTGFSSAAVNYWLNRFGLVTRAAKRRADGRRAKADGCVVTTMDCAAHGRTEFVLEGRGAYRCLKCRRERVADRRRRVKEILVAEAGGACALCGYDRVPAALQFHHLDPTMKSFGIGEQGATRSIAAMRAEAAKCVLVCANCHAELEADLQTLDETADRVIAGPEASAPARCTPFDGRG
jgi:transposase/DNA-directed RNA polymerase subunit RPC12/RpoP